MPRYTPSQLRWSEQAQSYVLSIGDQTSPQVLTSDWLEHIASFSFHSRWDMHYTVRKQRVQRGSSYWYAYRRLHGRIVKRYLGKVTDLTLARLEEVALQLKSESSANEVSLQFSQETERPQSSPGELHTGDFRHHAPIEALPLLLSKLSPPHLPAFLLDRSHLFALLDEGREGPFTLLSAPAGFGKTTLVCQWLAARNASRDFLPVAWFSLETSDNDLLRFWRYLITACQAFQVDFTQVYSILAALNPQPPFLPSSFDAVLTALLNALAEAPTGGVLVLEDYHAITEHAIHETFSFFLEHLPATLHVLLITRADPPFTLVRLRARQRLCEVRTADLSFSQEETCVLLHHALPFRLTDKAIKQLHAQLEGWGTGLHLLKLALLRMPAPVAEEQALALVSRNATSFQDYFVTEVLEQQPEVVQQFLLQTSILTRLTGSLCDAVTEQQNSQERLSSLERINLFLEPLNAAATPLPQASRQWYRYHALFAEALRNEACRRYSADYLHRLFLRASHWYELQGFLHEAIDAALSAQDYTRAALLLARFIEDHTIPGEVQEPHTLQRWFDQLPVPLLEQNPVLCLCYATTLLLQSTAWVPDASSLPLMKRLLGMAERRWRAENTFPKLGELFAFRALFALRQGDMQAATLCAQQALAWLPQTQDIWRGLSSIIASTEWVRLGYFQQARNALLEAHARLATTNNHLFCQVATIKLAQAYFELGEIQQAARYYRQALETSGPAIDKNHTNPLANWRCTALLGLAALSYECNELERASQLLHEAVTLSQAHTFLHHEVHALLVLARVQQAQGNDLVAQQQLATLLEQIPASQSELVQDIQTAQVRLALSTGDHMTLQRWAATRTLRPDFAQRSEEDLLLARWLRSQGKEVDAYHQLERLLLEAREVGHTRRILEVMVEMALSTLACKHKAEAQGLLREVLVLALPNTPLRLFVAADTQMVILLHSLIPQLHDRPLLAYIRTLLEAFPAQQQIGAPTLAAVLVEPLSPQELRVLRLLVEHRTNAEIAEELVVSINTVRTQVQSIYSKLGVHKRSAASDVARDLKLL
jgi:LuxR family maltose regulon positive regulatory protein